MKTSLTKGLEAGEKREVEQEFASSYHFRQQVIKHMNEKIEAIQVSMRDVERYKDASWAYYQADRLGQIRAYQEIISLFS